MRQLVLLLADGSLLVVALLLVRMAEARRQQRSLVAYRLQFPRGLEVDAVESFLSGLSGLLLPWWKRWLASPYVSLEVHANSSGIRHYLLVPEPWATTVEGLLQAAVPSVRYEPTELPPAPVNMAVEYRLSTHDRSLRVDAAGMNAKLLASLQPLQGQETVVVQMLLTPHGLVQPPRLAGQTEQTWLPVPQSGAARDGEAITALKDKQSHPLLLGVPRIGVRCQDANRARKLLRHAQTAWHEGRAPGVHLRRRLVPKTSVATQLGLRRPPLITWPTTLNATEAAGLIGWPVGAVAVPGLALGGCRLVPASPLVPSTGMVLADATFPGDARPLALSTEGQLRHLHVLGPTGTGKSTLLVNLITQAVATGHSVVALDPKGDTIQAVLERVPDWRRDDVIVLDPADTTGRLVGLNPMQSVDEDHAEVVVENLVGLFKSLYRHSWGPRLDDILRAALLTLAGTKGTTLCEVPLILTDPSYRRRLVGRLDDPVGLESFWGWYESISDAERQAAVGPVLNKVRAFTMRPRVRSIIGQSRPKLSLRDVLEHRKVLLVSLASGLLGDEASALMGALVVSELWNATLARAALPVDRRTPVMGVLDEWQHFLHLPTPMATVLAEARGLGLGLVLAHQELGQVPEDVRRAVLANARSRVIFQLPAADASLVARELGGVLTADDLQGLGGFEVALQLYAGGNTQPVATGRTRPLGEPTSSAAAIRELSRQRYGIDRAEVERQIRDRQTSRSEAPTGRRRRQGGQS